MTEKVMVFLRRVVQVISSVVGVLGIIWVYFGLRFLAGAITDRGAMGWVVALTFLVFGGVLIAVAWQIVFRYSPSAITSISALFGFAVYGFLSQWVRVIRDSAWNEKDIPAQGFWIIIPVAMAWLSYRVAKWLLLRFTIRKAEHGG